MFNQNRGATWLKTGKKKMKKLTKIEKEIISLIGYETRESEFIGWGENKKINPEFIAKNRKRIKKEVSNRKVSDNFELLKVLQYESRKAEKKAKKEEQDRIKGQRIREKKESVRKRVERLIKDEACKRIVTKPSKAQAKKAINSNEFKSLTTYAREYYLKKYIDVAFEEIMQSYNEGVHYNFYKVSNEIKKEVYVDVDKESDWGIYSKRTKFPAYHYHFTLYMPSTHSFAKIGGLLTVFKGRTIKREGMSVIWFDQGRGMNLNPVNGWLVRGYHVKKSKKINSLKAAQNHVRRIRDNVAKQIATKRFFNALNAKELRDQLKLVWITKQDSIDAGNCPAGTEQFRQAFQSKRGYGEIGAVRADFLLDNPNGSINFIKRILKHKLGVTV